ncbi:MAG: ABC transporter substrate-binding protein [Burkholderiales bacterium]|nr:ABC transporter substrate-binding protein [Burkholderiales bacterium]
MRDERHHFRAQAAAMGATRRFAAHCAAALALACAGAAAPSAQAQAQTVYNIAGYVDYTGPFAVSMPSFDGGRKAVIEWWNQEVGAKEGVRLAYKAYDMRYDASQAASLWPGIKSELSPIAVMSMGGPDSTALQARLPDDRIPAMLGLPAYGFTWKEGSWVYNPRPTNAHEVAGFIDWFQAERLKGARPVKFAMVTAESPAFMDTVRGVQSYLKTSRKGELIEVITTDMQPADLTLQVRRVINAGADFIVVYGNGPQAVATKRAIQALGKKVPILIPSHVSLAALGKSLGSMEALEGDFESGSVALATDDDSEAKQFYGMLTQKYGLKQPWVSTTIMGMANALFVVRVTEAAIAKVGAKNLNGAALQSVLANGKFDASLFNGVLPGFTLSNNISFPLVGTRVNVATVSGGKIVYAVQGAPIPTVEKW